jgi:hypothetical protein
LGDFSKDEVRAETPVTIVEAAAPNVESTPEVIAVADVVPEILPVEPGNIDK